MFYRPGGSTTRINAQYDEVYADMIGGATGWLPVAKSYWVAVNISRAMLRTDPVTGNSCAVKTTTMPEAVIILEQKTIGGQHDSEAWPLDQWQNAVVASGRRANADGWVRLRIANINNRDGTGVSLRLQVSRTGDPGVSG
jgi:hypothetical protein